MAEFLDRVVWLLIFIRDQCMPVTIGTAPNTLDYFIVGVTTCVMIGGTIWFAWGLTGRDGDTETRLKAQVLED